MAYRHVISILPTASAGPSTIKRFLTPSPFFLSKPLCPIRPCRRIPPHRWISTSSPLRNAEKKGDEKNDIWNLPAPPISSKEQEVIKDKDKIEERGLPIPDNIATSSTSFSGTRSTAGHDVPSSTPTDSSRDSSPSVSTSLPNYPTLPPSPDISSSDPTPKLASPNVSSDSNQSSSKLSTSKSMKLPTSISIPPEVRERITEWSSTVLQHSKRVAKDTEKRLVELGLKVNQMTGYQEVERLKSLVFQKEDNLQSLRESARSAKTAYDEAVSTRSNAQRDVNALLERKHSWSDSDVIKFTNLVRQDHSSTHLVGKTSIELKESELKVDKAFNELMQTILQRYHEEQVWSDKIRSVSTWANLLGLALNAFIFLTAIIIVEPWKRKRLVNKLEEKIGMMMNNVEDRLKGLEMNLVNDKLVSSNVTIGDLEIVHPTEEPIKDIPTVETIKEEEILPEDTPIPVDIPIYLTESPLDPIIPSNPTTIPVILEPIIKTNIEGLPPYLDIITQPSQERDMAVAGIAGAITMGILMTAGKWIFS